MTRLSPALNAAWRRVHTLWTFALGTPILYMLAAWLMDAWGWVDRHSAASHPWDNPAGRLAVGGLAAGLALAAIVMRFYRSRRVRRAAADARDAIGRWTMHFYIMASLADSLAFLGLVYYLISGRRWSILAGGAAAYLAYALAYPPQSDLHGLPDPPEDPEENPVDKA
jgi:hypothetical protein